MRVRKSLVAAVTIVAMLGAAGVAGAAIGSAIRTSGSGEDSGRLVCPGGMTRLGHPFDENMSIFPGDPAVHIELEYTVAEDFFLVEDIDTGAHAGTHLDVPAHFIDGGRTVDDLAAEEFVWPAYVIDVRDTEFENGFVGKRFIRRYERKHGRIAPGSLVILQTGAEEFFGLDGPGDARAVDGDDNADNTDDLFDFENAGFSGAAVQWLFDRRDIDGVGSDAYGPDSFADADYDATYTTLLNDGVALVALANLDSMSVNGDIIIASTVALTDGSGFSTDPIACHGDPGRRDDKDGDKHN